MKTKKFERKLTLKKTTVTNLDEQEMDEVNGGDTYWTASFTYSCSCNSVCSCVSVCGTCVCVSVQTGCYPNCTVPACPY